MDAMSLPVNQYCSIARALTVLGQKWNLLLLREAFLGRSRYAEFQQIGIPYATLGQRLDDLVSAGLLERRAYQEPGERTREEYVLTPAGRDTLPVLVALSEWGEEHAPLPAGPAMSYVTTGERVVHLEFRDDRGAEVSPETVSVVRGPGYHAVLAANAAPSGVTT
jgi:DNA-binding HxlR family transcriptional regulator